MNPTARKQTLRALDMGTVALALLIMLLPIRRAVHFRPGDAIRYA